MAIQMQPLYWRLNERHYAGINDVSLIMPNNYQDNSALEFPTQVSFQASKTEASSQDMRWSQDDIELFFTLLERLMQQQLDGNVEVDLTDKSIQAIVQLVAQMRFQKAWQMHELEADDFITQRSELSVGDLAALNTCYGYPLAIVVDLDSVEATCVLLTPVSLNEKTLIAAQSLVKLNRVAVLPAAFAEEENGEYETRH